MGKKSKVKGDKYFDNIHVQRWVQECVQQQMDAAASLVWLGSEVLLYFFKKVAFDNYTSQYMLLLVTFAFIWTLARYARVEHPGSNPLRIGHNIILTTLSGGGKNGAMWVCSLAAMNALDLLTADFVEHDLGYDSSMADDDDDDEEEEKDEDANTRAAKAKAIREKVQQSMGDALWTIDWSHEKKVFSLCYRIYRLSHLSAIAFTCIFFCKRYLVKIEWVIIHGYLLMALHWIRY